MADAPLLAMDVLQWARHHRNFPGQGQFDVDSFFEQVLRSGYAGPLSLEIFNDVFRETPNRRTAVDAMRSLLLLESQARGRLERGDNRDRRRDAAALARGSSSPIRRRRRRSPASPSSSSASTTRRRRSSRRCSRNSASCAPAGTARSG